MGTPGRPGKHACFPDATTRHLHPARSGGGLGARRRANAGSDPAGLKHRIFPTDEPTHTETESADGLCTHRDPGDVTETATDSFHPKHRPANSVNAEQRRAWRKRRTACLSSVSSAFLRCSAFTLLTKSDDWRNSGDNAQLIGRTGITITRSKGEVHHCLSFLRLFLRMTCFQGSSRTSGRSPGRRTSRRDRPGRHPPGRCRSSRRLAHPSLRETICCKHMTRGPALALVFACSIASGWHCSPCAVFARRLHGPRQPSLRTDLLGTDGGGG